MAEIISKNQLTRPKSGQPITALNYTTDLEILRQGINRFGVALTADEFKAAYVVDLRQSDSSASPAKTGLDTLISDGGLSEGEYAWVREYTHTDGTKSYMELHQYMKQQDGSFKWVERTPGFTDEVITREKLNAVTGGSTITIADIQNEINKAIGKVGGNLDELDKQTVSNISLLQQEIEQMNDGRKTTMEDGTLTQIKEKQDKFADDQFIETADVDYLDVGKISSAAGITADLTGVKKDVNDLKAKDTNLEGTLNGLQKKVDNLATNTVITTIEKKADDNAAAIAGLATNPTISGISSKATANDAAIKALQTKEQNDINKVNTDLTTAQSAIDTKIAGKADKTVTDALTGRVGTAETKITALETKSNSQDSTVTQHTTKIGALETTVGAQAGTLQTHGTTLTGHTQGIAKNVEDIKDLKNLASFMGIYVPSSFPHTTTASEVKTHFKAAKLGMFAFVKASAAGDTYEIWTAEAITVGGVPQATGDWVHEPGADITINMKPYLAMKMKSDLSGQEPPTVKGQVIYGNTLDPQDNKWTNLTEVLKDAYESKLIAANKDKRMTIVNTGTDAAPVWGIDFVEDPLQGTDLLMEVSGGWSAGYTPQIGDVVVVNTADADGKITKLGATVAKAMFGESEEKTPGSGVWTAKTDSKDKMVVGGDNTTKLVYIDNPDFTTLGTDTRPRIWTFRNSDTKGGWQPLDEAEINGKANFVGTDTGKILVVKAVDATTGNVELEPIALTEADIQKIKDDATALDARVGQNESDILALDNLKTDVADLKDTTVPALDTKVTDLEAFQKHFDDAVDGGYVFKTDDTNYETKTIKQVAAQLVDGDNFGTTDAEKEAKLMTTKEIKDAIKDSLEPRQKELINFQQQKTKPDGTPEYEADGVTPVMVDLGDDDKPVKFTGAKDTALTQASSLATNAAQGVVVTTGTDLTVSQMVGKDADAADGTPGPANDDKKLMSKKKIESEIAIRDASTLKGEALWNALVSDKHFIIHTKTSTTADAISDENVLIRVHSKDDTAGIKFSALSLDNDFHTTGELTFAKPAAGNTTDLPEVIAKKVAASSSTTTVIKNKGKVSDYINDIAAAEASNRFIRFWHKVPGSKKIEQLTTKSGVICGSEDGKYMALFHLKSYSPDNNGIYVSNDYGATINKITGGPASSANVQVGSYFVSPNGKVMMSASSSKIWISNNYGVTWVEKNNTSNKEVMNVDSSNDGKYIIIGCKSGRVLTSIDYGATFTLHTDANWGDVKSVASTADGSIFVLAGNDYSAPISTSKDYGSTWTKVHTTKPSSSPVVKISSDGKYIAALTYDGWSYYSHDFGATWTDNPQISETFGIGNLSMSQDGKYLFASAQSGKVYISSDYGVTYTAKTVSSTVISKQDIDSTGKNMILVDLSDDLYLSTDYGTTWTLIKKLIKGGTPYYVKSSYISGDGQIIAATSDGTWVGENKSDGHHHAIITEVDKQEKKVFSWEQGKSIEVGNLQLSDSYHIEIEVNTGTTIADGTSTGGDAAPTPVV